MHHTHPSHYGVQNNPRNHDEQAHKQSYQNYLQTQPTNEKQQIMQNLN